MKKYILFIMLAVNICYGYDIEFQGFTDTKHIKYLAGRVQTQIKDTPFYVGSQLGMFAKTNVLVFDYEFIVGPDISFQIETDKMIFRASQGVTYFHGETVYGRKLFEHKYLFPTTINVGIKNDLNYYLLASFTHFSSGRASKYSYNGFGLTIGKRF